MKILKKILVAIDFTKYADNVLENAIGIATVFDATITLVYVMPDDISNKKAVDLLVESAKEHLQIARKKIEEKGVNTSKSILDRGNYFDKILVAANNENANIIVVGAGNKNVDEVFKLGTTAEKLIRRSKKPVWVVKQNKPLEISSILCPVDFSEESGRALQNAITIARRFDAELVVLSVCKDVYSDSLISKLDFDLENEEVRKEHKLAFEKFLQGFAFGVMNWKKEIRAGDPSEEILASCIDHNSNLLIIGSTGKSGLSRFLLGSVTEKVIREVPCSFITLKSEDVIALELESKIKDIEKHYANAVQLQKDGLFDEAINEYFACLSINDMHLASLKGLADVYECIGDDKNMEKYHILANEVITRLWDRKIEDEIRNLKKF